MSSLCTSLRGWHRRHSFGAVTCCAVWLCLAGSLPVAHAAPLKADPPVSGVPEKVTVDATVTANAPLALQVTGEEILAPATGHTVLLTGHSAGSTTREVRRLPSLELVGTLTGRFDTGTGAYAVSPSGSFFTATKKKSFTKLGVELWSIEKSEKLKAFDLCPLVEEVIWTGFCSEEDWVSVHRLENKSLRIRLWNLESGKVVQEMTRPESMIPAACALSPGGRLLAYAGAKGTIIVSDLSAPKEITTWSIPAEIAKAGRVSAIAFSPDGSECGVLLGEGTTNAAPTASARGGRVIPGKPAAAPTGPVQVSLVVWGLADSKIATQHAHLRLPGGVNAPERLNWLPDGSAWLVGGEVLLDRTTGYAVWRFVPPAAGWEKLPHPFLGLDYILLPRRSGNSADLVCHEIEWKQIDAGLQGLQGQVPALLKPGQTVKLEIAARDLKFSDPATMETTLQPIVTHWLAQQGVVTDAKSVSDLHIKVHYTETDGAFLQKSEFSGFPPFGGRPPPFGGPFGRGRGSNTPPPETGTGTGFVIHPDGYLMTCAHVVGTSQTVQVKFGEKAYTGTVLARNAATDIALVKIDAKGLPALQLADSSKVQLGEEARAVGYPLSPVLGESIKVTRGTIAGIMKRGTRNMFQVDASINPGNSGGPLVSEAGEVLGINSAKLVGEDVDNVGFSIPINEILTMLQEQKVNLPKPVTKVKLAGPELVKQVTPAVALIVNQGAGATGPGGVQATRVMLTIAIQSTGQPTAWQQQLVVDPHSLSTQGELTDIRARDLAFSQLLGRLTEVTLPYYISNERPAVVLPGVTNLESVAAAAPANPPRRSKRGQGF